VFPPPPIELNQPQGVYPRHVYGYRVATAAVNGVVNSASTACGYAADAAQATYDRTAHAAHATLEFARDNPQATGQYALQAAGVISTGVGLWPSAPASAIVATASTGLADVVGIAKDYTRYKKGKEEGRR
jgi:hypothetical protein